MVCDFFSTVLKILSLANILGDFQNQYPMLRNAFRETCCSLHDRWEIKLLFIIGKRIGKRAKNDFRARLGRNGELRNKEQILKQRKRRQRIQEKQRKGKEKNLKRKQSKRGGR